MMLGRSRIDNLIRDAESPGRIVGVRFPPVDEDEPEPGSHRPPGAGKTERSAAVEGSGSAAEPLRPLRL